MQNKAIDLVTPLICTWLELVKVFEPLHMHEQSEVDRLHDIYVNSVPDLSYTVAVPGARFDERKPRPGDNLKHIINPLALAKWIQQISAKRGFPYSERQALNIVFGVEDYG